MLLFCFLTGPVQLRVRCDDPNSVALNTLQFSLFPPLTILSMKSYGRYLLVDDDTVTAIDTPEAAKVELCMEDANVSKLDYILISASHCTIYLRIHWSPRSQRVCVVVVLIGAAHCAFSESLK